MTGVLIHLDEARARRATGQPLIDKPRMIPIREVRRHARAGIIGMRVRTPSNIIGTVSGCFECSGVTFARITHALGTLAEDVRRLTFLDDGPEVA